MVALRSRFVGRNVTTRGQVPWDYHERMGRCYAARVYVAFDSHDDTADYE